MVTHVLQPAISEKMERIAVETEHLKLLVTSNILQVETIFFITTPF